MVELRDRMINEVIRIEGGYSDNPADSGGETNYGITSLVAKAYGYHGKMIGLPRQTAFDIYVDRYWSSIRGDQMIKLSEMITEEVLDTGINMGVSRAAKYLQRALNALNDSENLYSDLVVDGNIGSGTIKGLELFMLNRNEDEAVLSKVLNCLQGSKYVSLVEAREKDEQFFYGWVKNRVKIKD